MAVGGAVREVLSGYLGEGEGIVARSTRIAASTQAEVFVVDVGDSASAVVVKLFDCRRPEVRWAVEQEFESLRLMHEAFAGFTVNGWSVDVPEPLFRSDSPPAIVMTFAPGSSLENLLAGGELPAATCSALVELIIGALCRYWSSCSRLIGDVHLGNVLCDVGTRSVMFLDPGMPKAIFECPGAGRRFYPASRDLAYMVFDVCARKGRDRALGRGTPALPAEFAARVVQRYLEEHVGELTPAFLAEFRACLCVHLGRISSGFGITWPWRRYVRRKAERELECQLARVQLWAARAASRS